MNKITGVLLSLGMGLSVAGAASYIVPLEYDNIRMSVKSTGYAIIKPSTVDNSVNRYTIGGQLVNYKCIPVAKLKCAVGSPTISPSLSEVSLRHPTTGEVVTLWSADIRVEESVSGTPTWFLCAAAYGGEKSDSSVMQVINNADGSRSLKYDYKPNVNRFDVFGFVQNVPAASAPPPGGVVTSNGANSSSFLTILYNQVCR